jgi:outer membrane protein
MNLYRRCRKHCSTLAVVLMLVSVGASAQTGGTTGAAATAPTKVGVLNVRQAIGSTAEGKQALAQLQSQFTPQQNDLDNLQKQIQDLQNRLNNGARTLSDDEKARLQRQGEMLARQFQRKQDDLGEQVNAAQADIVDEIGRKMLDVLDRYSREKGFAVVLDSSAQGSPLLYQASQVEITQDIVRLYDQDHPAKAGSAAPNQTPGQTATPAPSRKP